jgi:nucleotide-diphospho-sugar transferase
MDFRICYVLADPGLGTYADMACISAQSFRALHPGREIVLLCDSATRDAIRHSQHPIRLACDTVITAEPPLASPPLAQSRWLKTSLRRLVPGELLYLDVDTVVVRPVELHPEPGQHLLAACDKTTPDGTPAHRTSPWVDALFAQLAWPMPALYRNSGVIFLRDSDAARAACDRWHTRWLEGADAGCWRDQPAFNAMAGEMAGTVGLLPTRFNAAPTYRARLARNAHIYHFWVGADGDPGAPLTLLDHLVDSHRRDGSVDLAMIDWCRRHSHPWLTGQGVRRALEAGAYRIAVRELFRRILRRDRSVWLAPRRPTTRASARL